MKEKLPGGVEHLAAHVEPDGGAGGAVPLEAGDLVLAVICNQGMVRH